MAKKKRKHRTPIAPPIHSAPATSHSPAGPSGSTPPSAPAGPSAPVGSSPRETPAARPRRESTSSRAAARRRKSKRRTYLIVGSIVALLVAAIVAPRILTNRADQAFGDLGRPAGCGDIQDTGKSGAGDHLAEGERTTYEPIPPSHGPHAGSTVPAGFYEEPLSDNPNADFTIYEAVHSIEHGAVVVWHDGLKKDEVDELDRTYSGEEKVIVTEYPPLRGDDHVAMTAWGRLVKCEKLSTKVIDAFIERFREARTAPEPKNAI